MKRSFSILLVLAVLFGALCLPVWADADVTEGDCGYGNGQYMKWSYDVTSHVLTITGAGMMYDCGTYSEATAFAADKCPWAAFTGEIVEVCVGEGVKNIGTGAFYGCTALERVTLPASLQTISACAFQGCSKLSTVVYEGEDLYEIGAYAFSGTALTEAFLPASVQKIGEGAYEKNKALTTALLPEGMTVLPARIFADCGALQNVTLPESLVTIGASAFYNCDTMTAVTFPSAIESVGNAAFGSCDSLARIHISTGAKGIDGSAFIGCNELDLITLDSDSETYAVKNGILRSKDMSELILCPRSLLVGEFVVPEDTTVLGPYVFGAATELKAVILPDGLTEISDHAFYRCMALNVIKLPESLVTIGDYAFYYCTSLAEAILPESLETIGAYAFTRTALTTVIFPVGVKTVGAYAYNASYSIADAVVLGMETELGEGCFKFTEANVYARPESLAARDIFDDERVGSGMYVPLDPDLDFIDIDAQDWSYEGIRYATVAGLFRGVDPIHFAPASAMTRAMLVTVLWRMEGSPESDVEIAFTDVADDSYYYGATRWAVESGIVNGVSATEFMPNANVTREQMATILYRYAQYLGMDVSASVELSDYADAETVGDYARDAFCWASAVTVIRGSNDEGVLRLNPQGASTRAQVATVLMRFADVRDNPPAPVDPDPVDPDPIDPDPVDPVDPVEPVDPVDPVEGEEEQPADPEQ